MITEEKLQEELLVAKKKSAKPMLWVSMISMVMFFAGLTSAYVISMRRDDWVSFDLPQAFYLSTVLISLSSVFLVLSERFIKSGRRQASLILVVLSLLFGIGLFGNSMLVLIN